MEFVESAWSDDKEAMLEEIMNLYGKDIKRLLFTYTNNWSVAEDLTQEVFITVYKKVDQFQGKSSMRTWIYAIAINKCKDYFRSWHYKKVILKEKINKPRLDYPKTPQQILQTKEHYHEIMNCIKELPMKYKEVLLLHYYFDLSLKEIEEALQIKGETAKTRLRRGREKLKLSLRRRGLNDV